MTDYLIRDATASDARALVRTLRAGDLDEIHSVDFGASRAVWRSFQRSIYRRAAEVDGELACMWGVGGNLLGTGEAWLLTAPPVERAPLAFAREGRREVAKMLGMFSELVIGVHCDYTAALRLVQLWGFRAERRIGSMIILELP